MLTIRDLINKIMPKRLLYAQILFTALAFLAMVVLSYRFISSIVHNHLIQNAQSVLDSTQGQIDAELLEPKVTLSVFSRTIRRMIFDGDDLGNLQDFINDISAYISGQELSSFDGIFFCFDSLTDSPFMNSMHWIPPDDYDLTETLWYQHTKAAKGEIAETLSYPDIISGDAIIIFSRCIHDDEDNHLAVVGLRIRMSAIGKSIIDTAQVRGGYGMLLSEDLMVLTHPYSDYVGRYAADPALLISGLADDFRKGVDVSEYSLTSYNNEDAVAFFRSLPNGWYLGLIMPKGLYFESVTAMMLILSALGLALAVALIIILIRIDAARQKSDLESRHKSAFLANMSHEIRTPMNAIIGMTTIGKSASDTERKDYCFTKIHDASNHLLGVINDILDMSKIEANKFELSPEEFNFEKMLQRVVNVVTFRVDEKRQKLTVHIDRTIPKTLIADEQRLAQVVTNLLGNAVKFTPEEGSITLAACFVEEELGDCIIQISVSDTGIGISTEQQGRLFDAFEQAESSTTRKFGGTGLGLAISKSIVEMMGGTIWVDSEPGKGSAFTFTVHVRRGTERRQALLNRNVNWDNVHIMAIDDDPDILAYFNEIAQGFGVSCDTARSGEEALALVERNGAYHIYFVDWKMPVMDGIQLTRELKTRTSAHSVVIMISAAEWSTVAEEAKGAGIDKFLSKPLFPSSIADSINESFGMGKLQAEEAHANISGVFAGKHILLAEDVEINREVVLALLEPTGLEIDCAENGAQAVRMFSEAPQKYDMIFMDVQMPEMDGYEATRSIRALEVPQAKTIRIVAMTANVFREDIEKCLEAGMDNHLGKPLDFDDVMDKLRIYLQ